jgi:hypothetical protein
MNNVCKLAPPGIDIVGRKQWAIARRFGREIRNRLEEVALELCDPECFAFAAGRYVEGLEESLLKEPVPRYGRALCRLARAHVHRLRKEIANDPSRENERRLLAAVPSLSW